MTDTEKLLAEIEEREAPARWPPRLAMALGVVCFVAAAAVTHGLSGWRADVVTKAATLRAAIASGSSDAAIVAGPGRDHREAEVRVGGWERRRLGLLLATMVLLVGGFVASGMRTLHDKMRWVVSAEEEEQADLLNNPDDSSTDPPPDRSSSGPE